MALALPHPLTDMGKSLRVPLLGLAAVRMAFSFVAALAAPALWSEHFVLVVLMRPTKEVLLAAGFKLRLGDVGLLPVVASVIPLGVLGVWLFYLLGRAYADELHGGDGLPKWARRVLPQERVEQMCELLDRRGLPVVVLGRLAVFPSTLMAAAAGASGMSARKFVLADGIGAALSTALVLVVGFVLGEAYDEGGPWLTGAGVVVTMALLFAVGYWLKSDRYSGGGGA